MFVFGGVPYVTVLFFMGPFRDSVLWGQFIPGSVVMRESQEICPSITIQHQVGIEDELVDFQCENHLFSEWFIFWKPICVSLGVWNAKWMLFLYSGENNMYSSPPLLTVCLKCVAPDQNKAICWCPKQTWWDVGLLSLSPQNQMFF